MMDIIDQGLQSPFLQQIDQKPRNKVSFQVKPKEDAGSGLQAGDLNDFTSSLLLDASCANSSAIVATDSLNVHKTLKSKSKNKNKNKKKRLKKKFSGNAVKGGVEVANQPSSLSGICLKDIACRIKPSSCDRLSFSGSESIGSCSKDGSNYVGKLFSGPFLDENSVRMRGHIFSDISDIDQATCRINSGRKEIEVANRSIANKKIVVLGGTIYDPKDQKETLDVGYLLPKGSRENVKSRIGKENNHFIWQRIRRSSNGEQALMAKNSVPIELDVSLNAATLLGNNSLPTAGLISSPIYVSPGHKSSTARVKEVKNSEQGMRRNHDHVLRESPHWVAEQKCHGACGQGLFRLRQDDPLGSKICIESNEKLDLMCKTENTSHPSKGSWQSKTSLYRLQTKINLSQKEPLEEHSTKTGLYRRISDPSDQSVLPEVQQQTCMKFSRSGLPMPGSIHASLDNEAKRSACLAIQASCEDNIRDDFTSGVAFREGVMVGKKDSGVPKSSGSVDAYSDLINKTVSCYEKLKNVPLCSMLSSNLDGANSLSLERIPDVIGTRISMGRFEKPGNHGEENYRGEVTYNNFKDISFSFIGSQKMVQALHASYRLQVASETVHLETGNLLGEFERVLHSVSPVVPASNRQNCLVCMENRLHNSICNQVPNIPLGAVWSWYEKSGNYGLEVIAEDPPNLNGLDTDTVLFHAHFVPFLSAVQLFAHSQTSQYSCIGNLNTVMPENAELRIGNFSCPCPRDASISTLDLSASDGNGSFDLTSILACPDNLELVFEYFESEQPQQRRPLFEKIMELIKVGNSDHKVYGDSSKLECMDLHDLHPASWYSVAWYPIYRIPEGNFRASFLTYHSLGHFIHRCTSSVSLENAFGVVSPVVGLESYNAQGECWFLPRKALGSSNEGPVPLNTSEILKQRLRTLGETASLLSRGHVLKDKTEVANRHPDYEFFLSRKR